MKTEIRQTLEVLRNGGLILYPTDTVWGIGCDATDEEAVRRVFTLKRRSDSKSLVLLAGGIDVIQRFVDDIPPMAQQLIEVNDAPMTIIYPGGVVADGPLEGLAPSCVASDGSVGIRIPASSQFCMELLEAFGKPIVSTSANISGAPAPDNYDQISDEIRCGVDFVVPPSCEGRSTGRSSQIIKVDMDGTIKIIRA